MKRVYYLSAQECDHITDDLISIYQRSLLMRGLLCMYVTESEFMEPITVNQLVNILWDLTEDFCTLLSTSREIISNTEPILVVDEDERSED